MANGDEIAGGFGVTINSGSSSGADPQDLPIYWGVGFQQGWVNQSPPGAVPYVSGVMTRGGMVENKSPRDGVTLARGQVETGQAGLVPQYSTMLQSEANLYLLNLQATDEQAFWDIGDRMQKLGYFKGDTYTADEVKYYWSKAVEEAGLRMQASQRFGGPPLTINQILRLNSPALGGTGFSDSAGSATGVDRLLPQTRNVVERNISSRSEIKGAARDLASRELGRELSNAELDRMVARLQGAQANTPRRTTTIETPTDKTHTDVSQTVRGGLDAQTYMTDQLRANPDYAEHQAAAVYAPALFQALGATV